MLTEKEQKEWAENIKVVELVRNGQKINFSRFRDEVFFYTILINNIEFEFQVPLEDFESGVTLLSTDKALLFMKYIKKNIKEKTLTYKILQHSNKI